MNALLIPWLDYQLKGDCNAWSVFQNLLSAGQGINSLQNCTVCLPSSVLNAINQETLTVFPVPASGSFFIRTKADEKISSVRIYHLTGKKVSETIPLQQNDLLWKTEINLSAGLYLLEMITAKEKLFRKLIIQ
jgi:hypothetical protein